MHRSLVLILAGVIAGSTVRADAPPADLAARAWAVTDAVLANHVEPPTRQQMLLAGVKAVEKAAHVSNRPGLARRVSDLATPEQLGSLLAEILASPRIEVAARTTPEASPRNRPFRGTPLESMKPEEALFEGMFSVVSGGATLLSAKDRKVAEQFEANLYVGIQVALGMDETAKRPTFQEILEGGPADHAGAKAGDRIEEVDGTSTEGMPMREVVDRLRGEEGTDVQVRLFRPGSKETLLRSITRGRLPRKTIKGLSPLAGGREEVRLDGPWPIGYLKMTEIIGSTPQELRIFAEQLEAEEIRALVIDLRNVNRALFHPTVLLADALLDGGTIGRVREADSVRTYRAEPDALFRGWPMVVLAEDSQSAEVAWLCAALHDNQRATILGIPIPAEAAIVQTTVTLPGGEWSVEMATGRLERGDGRPIVGSRPETLWNEVSQAISDPEQAPKILNFNQYADNLAGADRFSPRPGPGKPRLRQADPLARAREILGEALKATGK